LNDNVAGKSLTNSGKSVIVVVHLCTRQRSWNWCNGGMGNVLKFFYSCITRVRYVGYKYDMIVVIKIILAIHGLRKESGWQ